MSDSHEDRFTSDDPMVLFQEAYRGDRVAEQKLFQRLTVRFRYIAKRYAMEADAEDLVQDACTTVFEKFRSENFTVSFYAWAHGVLRMKIGNYIQMKRKNSQKEIAFVEEAVDRGYEAEPIMRRYLFDCLSRLVKHKPRYARILNLTHQGFTTGQICERLEMNSNQYYVTLNRSRSMLKACLQNKGLEL